MRKKSGLIALILVILFQLCIPTGMVVWEVTENNRIVKNGLCVKLELESFSYSNGKLHLDTPPLPDDGWNMQYAELVHNAATGYYELQLISNKPTHDFYIKSSQKTYFEFPANKIKVDKFENLDYLLFFKENEDDDWVDKLLYNQFKRAYLEAYVYKGKVIPVAVYIDGKEADEYLNRLNENRK